ncbi:hypothetical protein Ahy_A05g024431 [Arachis hypogaea]|uniref:TF-B3 domain-containing protein n=1 Tax=Arachis hypogaea TaxID=3818 RepID=A0A445D629_ARAHY|nr:hypothetical protein Ahy_A05g024431 [Arachis hypogaea]
MAPLDKQNNPIYMDFYESHYVKDIIGISLLKVIQDKLGLNYFDALDNVASSIEDNGMHENIKRPFNASDFFGVRWTFNASDLFGVRWAFNASDLFGMRWTFNASDLFGVWTFNSSNLFGVWTFNSSDLFGYILYQFAKLLLESGSENWKFVVEESKITTSFEINVLKNKGKEQEYKIGPKWKYFVKMHKLKARDSCVFGMVSKEDQLIRVSVTRK